METTEPNHQKPKKNKGGRPTKKYHEKQIFRFTFSLNIQEQNLFLSKLEASGLKRKTDFFLAMLHNKKMVCTPPNSTLQAAIPALIKMAEEMRAIGNNINQATKAIHTEFKNTSLNQTTIAEFSAELKQSNQLLEKHNQLLEKIQDQW